MKYMTLLFVLIIFFGKSNAVITVNPEKDEESIQKAKEVNNVAQIFIKNKERYIPCTASLITPNIMITAAHCVGNSKKAFPGDPFSIQGFASFHADTDDAFKAHFNNIPDIFVPIDAAIIHPERSGIYKNSTEKDIAFIRLTTPQEKSIFHLYNEDLKPQIETFLNPSLITQYNIVDNLLDCYGFGFGKNIPEDSKRRAFFIPSQIKECNFNRINKEFKINFNFFGIFPNDKTAEYVKNFPDFQDMVSFNSKLIKKIGAPLHMFPNQGDSGAPILFKNHIIGVVADGVTRSKARSLDENESDSEEDVDNFESVPSLYGILSGSGAPLFDMMGDPIKKVYNMIPILASFDTLNMPNIDDLVNDYIRAFFKLITQFCQQTPANYDE